MTEPQDFFESLLRVKFPQFHYWSSSKVSVFFAVEILDEFIENWV